MEQFEMKYHWDDQEEAYYRGTPTHRQNGCLKTWKLDHESQEQYQTRTRELVDSRIQFIGRSMMEKHGRFGGVDKFKIR
jgi:hypothetical protein